MSGTLGGAQTIGGIVVEVKADTSQLRSAEGEIKTIGGRIESNSKFVMQVMVSPDAKKRLVSDMTRIVSDVNVAMAANPLRLPVVLDTSGIRAQLSNLTSGQGAAQIGSGGAGVMLGGAAMLGYSAADTAVLRQMGAGRMLPSPTAKWVNSRVIGNGSGGAGGNGGGGGAAAGAAGDGELMEGAALGSLGGETGALAGEGASLGLRGMVRGFFIAEAIDKGLKIAAAGAEYSHAKRIGASDVEDKRQAFQTTGGNFPFVDSIGRFADNSEGAWWDNPAITSTRAIRNARAWVAHSRGRMSSADEEVFAKDQTRQEQQMNVLKIRSEYLGGVSRLAAQGSLELDRAHAARTESPGQRMVSDAKEALQSYIDTTVSEVKQNNHGQIPAEVKIQMGKLQRAVDDATRDLVDEKQQQLNSSNASLRAAGTSAYATIGSAYAGYIGATKGTFTGQRAALATRVGTANQQAANDVATAQGPLDYAKARLSQLGTWIGGNLETATLNADQKWIGEGQKMLHVANAGILTTRATGDEGAARMAEIKRDYAQQLRDAEHEGDDQSVIDAIKREKKKALAAQQKINDRNDSVISTQLGTRLASANASAQFEDRTAGVLGLIGNLKAELIGVPDNKRGQYLTADIAELKAEKAQLMRPTGYAYEEDRFTVAPGGPGGYSGADQTAATNALTEALKAFTDALKNGGLPN